MNAPDLYNVGSEGVEEIRSKPDSSSEISESDIESQKGCQLKKYACQFSATIYYTIKCVHYSSLILESGTPTTQQVLHELDQALEYSKAAKSVHTGGKPKSSKTTPKQKTPKQSKWYIRNRM